MGTAVIMEREVTHGMAGDTGTLNTDGMESCITLAVGTCFQAAICCNIHMTVLAGVAIT